MGEAVPANDRGVRDPVESVGNICRMSICKEQHECLGRTTFPAVQLEYEKLRLEREYGHIVALAERANFAAATAAVLLVGMVYIKTGQVKCTPWLFVPAGVALLAAFVCALVTFFMAVKRHYQFRGEPRTSVLLPPAHEVFTVKQGYGSLEAIQNYINIAHQQIRMRQALVAAAGVFLGIGALLMVLALLLGKA